MEPRNPFVTVDAYVGEQGIPSLVLRAQTLPGESAYVGAVRLLRLRGGCGAWRGRACCDESPAMVAYGAMRLQFSCYRAITVQDGLTVALLCRRHAGPFGQLTRDMPRPLRRSQEREYGKFLDRAGVERPDDDGVMILVEFGDVADA